MIKPLFLPSFFLSSLCHPTFVNVAVYSLGIGLVAIFNVQSFDEVSAQRETSDQIVDEIHSLQNYLVDIETGQRGFLITGDESFLDPNLVALTKIEPSLQRLRSHTANDQTLKALLLQQASLLVSICFQSPRDESVMKTPL